MDVKLFLLSDKTINRSELARRMWPGNKKPESYLSQKLTGLRVFTRRDAERALAVLRQMADEMNHISLEQAYPTPVPGPKPPTSLGPNDQEGMAQSSKD